MTSRDGNTWKPGYFFPRLQHQILLCEKTDVGHTDCEFDRPLYFCNYLAFHNATDRQSDSQDQCAACVCVDAVQPLHGPVQSARRQEMSHVHSTDLRSTLCSEIKTPTHSHSFFHISMNDLLTPQLISNLYIDQNLPFLGYIHCSFCLNLHITHGDMM